MNFNRIPRGPLALLCVLLALSALPGCSRGPRWTNLLDEDLSAWRIWQSYATPEEGFQGRLPLGEDGNPLPAIGYDKNEGDAFSTLKEGKDVVLRICSPIYGALMTRESFENYEFRMKVRYGKQAWGVRAGKAIDSGLIYNSFGEPGTNHLFSWKRGFECQLMASGTTEGNTGDFWGTSGTRADVRATRNEELRAWFFDPAGEPRAGSGFRAADNNSPDGEWTEVAVYCIGDKSLHVVNGQVVMAVENMRFRDQDGSETPITRGQIQLQCEAGELYVKDIRIRPLAAFPDEFQKYFPE